MASSLILPLLISPAGLSSPSNGATAPASPLPLAQSSSPAPVPSRSPQPPRPRVSDVVPLSRARAAEASGASSSRPRGGQSIASSRSSSPRLLQDADGELIPPLFLCNHTSAPPPLGLLLPFNPQ